MKDEQLLAEGEILADEILAGAEDADDRGNQVSEPRDHHRNLIELWRVESVAKSLELRMYCVLRTHRGLHFRHLTPETGMWSVTRVPCPGWLEISTLPP